MKLRIPQSMENQTLTFSTANVKVYEHCHFIIPKNLSNSEALL